MNEKKTITSGKALVKEKKGQSAIEPSAEDFAEVHSPALSTEHFVIADKIFKIKISNIKTQKIMARSLTIISDLLAKIDILPIIKGFRDRMRKSSSSELTEKIASLKGLESEEATKAIAELSEEISGDDFYVDLVEFVKDIVQHGGIDNIMIGMMDLTVGIVYAICHSQDNAITMDWIEENVTFYQAQDIFFRQMEKDEMQGRVIDFLALLIRQVVKKPGSE